jgi:hypothetical protein
MKPLFKVLEMKRPATNSKESDWRYFRNKNTNVAKKITLSEKQWKIMHKINSPKFTTYMDTALGHNSGALWGLGQDKLFLCRQIYLGTLRYAEAHFWLSHVGKHNFFSAGSKSCFKNCHLEPCQNR